MATGEPVVGRPTEDVDLFADPAIGEGSFCAAITAGERALEDAGLEVDRLRESPSFARLSVREPGGQVLDVDLAVNWRADAPVRMSVGPVLSQRDAVAGVGGRDVGGRQRLVVPSPDSP